MITNSIILRKLAIQMKEYDVSTQLWDEAFSECKLEDITDTVLEVEPTFDACLAIFANECHRVLDFGCGTGDILFQCAEFGHMTYGMGIDRSHTGIDYANQMVSLNHFRHLDFVTGDISFFSQMEDGCFDGIILSNVLDVMPQDIADQTFTELTRLVRDGGYIFLKLNPYADEETLEQLGLIKIKDNLYEEDGVLRLRELDTAAWHKQFEKNYTVERYLEFPYPWQDGMNRLFLLKKKDSTMPLE